MKVQGPSTHTFNSKLNSSLFFENIAITVGPRFSKSSSVRIVTLAIDAHAFQHWILK